MSKQPTSENKFARKLTSADVLSIVERCQSGETQKAVADDYPVSRAMVGRIMSGLDWSTVTGIEPHKPGYARGEAVAASKLTEDEVLEIVRRCDAGEPYASVARDFPVAAKQVATIMRGDQWSHLTDIEPGTRRRRGYNAPGAKLTEEDVLEIVRRHDAGEQQIHIAGDFPVNQSQISKIIRGKSWTHVTRRGPPSDPDKAAPPGES